MSSIFKISIGQDQIDSRINNIPYLPQRTTLDVIELLIIQQQGVEGPEISKISDQKFTLLIPSGWHKLREKELAAVRRTIAGAAIEIGKEHKPSIVYVTDVALCGLAGVIISRSFDCPLVLGLLSEDIDEGLFNERKVAILDSCISAAKAVAVTGKKSAMLLEECYPSLQNRVATVETLDINDPEVINLIATITHKQQNVPWTRRTLKSLLVSHPYLTGKEMTYVEEVIQSGWWGYGPVAKYLEDLFAQYCGNNLYALAVSSCTAALHLSLLAAGIGPGDEVIVPALTFVSTAAAVVHTGAKPVFADVNPLTLSIMPDDVARKLSRRTRAVIPVHFAGIPADTRSLEHVVEGKTIIIEDAAHAMGAEIDGRKIGSISPFTCFSFAATKQVASCAGGILVFQDGLLVRKLREISDMGLRVDTLQRSIGTSAGPANEVVSIGYRYRMNDVAAAIAIAQFEHLQEMMSYRSSLIKRYYSNLSSCERCELINVPEMVKPSWYIMPIRVQASIRDELRDYLASKGIDTSIHYPSLTDQPIFKASENDVPVASKEYKRLISLPLHMGMTNDDVDKVCLIIIDYISNKNKKT